MSTLSLQLYFIRVPAIYFRYVKPGSAMTGVIIDMDGPGPHPPAPVLCGLDNAGVSITAVQHDTEDKTKVDGFQAPGSFSQTIYYKVFYILTQWISCLLIDRKNILYKMNILC